MDHLCFVFCVCHAFGLFIAALWSPAGKGLTSWLLLAMFIVFFVSFPCGILGQVWYMIVSFRDLCHLSSFYNIARATKISEYLHFGSFYITILTLKAPRKNATESVVC